MSRPLSIVSRRVLSLALVAGLGMALASCGGPDSDRGRLPQTTAPATQPRATVPPGQTDPTRPATVALLVPLSGGNATEVGQAIANSARMAMTDLADATLDLRIHDTRGTPEGARAAAEAAVGEGAALILGPLFGRNTSTVGQVAQSAGINVISFSSDASVAGGPVFVSGFLPEAEAARIIGFAASRGHDRLAVFYPETAYGQAALRAAERAAGAVGARVVAAGGYPRSFEAIQNSSGPFSGAALSAGANAMLIPDSGDALRAAGAFLDYGGIDPARVQYLGLGQWNAPDTMQEATLRGGWFPAPDPNRFDTFSRLYSARHGSRPPLVAVLGYNAVQAAAQMLSEARATGSRTPFGRAEIARAPGFEGALGRFGFEPGGTSRHALAVLEVGAGGFQVIDPAPGRLDLLL